MCSNRCNLEASEQRLALRNDPALGETELSVPAERTIYQTVGYACLTCAEADLVSLDPLNLMTYIRWVVQRHHPEDPERSHLEAFHR